jgi:pimeloyl-ACP methyl ester carboxylesterase
VADAAGVLDAYRIAAHVVGVSAGGAFAQLLAIDFADRVRSLGLISTSAVLPGERELPASTEQYTRFVASAEADWSDSASVIEYLVGYSRVLAGGERPFDEAAVRELARRDIERARDFAAAQNHDTIADGGRSRDPVSSRRRSSRLGDDRPCDHRAHRTSRSDHRTLTATRHTTAAAKELGHGGQPPQADRAVSPVKRVASRTRPPSTGG